MGCLKWLKPRAVSPRRRAPLALPSAPSALSPPLCAGWPRWHFVYKNFEMEAAARCFCCGGYGCFFWFSVSSTLRGGCGSGIEEEGGEATEGSKKLARLEEMRARLSPPCASISSPSSLVVAPNESHVQGSSPVVSSYVIRCSLPFHVSSMSFQSNAGEVCVP